MWSGVSQIVQMNRTRNQLVMVTSPLFETVHCRSQPADASNELKKLFPPSQSNIAT